VEDVLVEDPLELDVLDELEELVLDEVLLDEVLLDAPLLDEVLLDDVLLDELVVDELLLLEAMQVPPMHVPPGHGVPSVALGFEHFPVVGAHVPATWHASSGVHTTGFVPVHAPAMQTWLWKQGSPLGHAVPSGSLDHAVVEVEGVHT
jgi:hypothetical protein